MKKQEKERIVQEMEEAMRELEKAKGENKESNLPPSGTPEQLHCWRCKTLMENGVCKNCGFKIYMPMDEAKKRKIRRILSVVCVVVFVVIYVIVKA